MSVPLKKLTGLRGVLLEQELLKNYTSWQVGGPAEYLYKPNDVKDLQFFLKTIPDNIPIYFLGLGSNVLIRDHGVKGVVILTQGTLKQINRIDANVLRVEAGVACTSFARFVARQNLSGTEFLAGIPGTIGGALTMNAGCYGKETWEYIKAVETINRKGAIYLRLKNEFEPSYRSVKRPLNEWFIAGHFVLSEGNKETSFLEIKTMLAKRNASQPVNLPNCGSVFKNPLPQYAACLIEACGLKGYTIGGASVSKKHANFIINNGTATAYDIEKLMQEMETIVFKEQGVRLIREICIIG